MVPLMPSLAKGTHVFRPSQQTVGVGVTNMGPPMEIQDSDEELPPQLTPPHPTSAALSSIAPSITSSNKHKQAALASASESLQTSSFGSGPSEKRQRGSAGVIACWHACYPSSCS